MPFNVELTEQETRCLQRYFERVDETEDLSFLHPEEFLAFQSIAGQVCRAGVSLAEADCPPPWETGRGADTRARADARLCAEAAGVVRESQRACEAAGFAACPAIAGDGDIAVLAESPVRALISACLRAFEAGDLLTALSMFSDDARVFSPLLGYCSAREFLTSVVGATGARLTLHDVLTNIEGRPQAVGYFLTGTWAPGGDAKGDESLDDPDVFYYVLNIDASRNVVRSMIVLDTWRMT